MLVNVDLRFLCSFLVVVVGWFLARRKWRRLVARREQIKMLMHQVSEETARVELEAAAGYSSYGSVSAWAPVEEQVILTEPSPGRQSQHHCEVCFSPTTTRCKQCKAVRYCSRKCQIIHWREGHKDECLTLVTHRNNNEALLSRVKDFKQGEINSSQKGIESEVTHATKTMEVSSREEMLSNSSHNVLVENKDILNVPVENKEIEDNTSNDGKRYDANVKESVQSLHEECSSYTNSIDELSTLDSNLTDSHTDGEKSPDVGGESMKPLLSRRPNSENDVVAFDLLDKPKSGCIDLDEKPISSTSSCCSATTGSEEQMFDEPLRPSPDFWAGFVKPIKSDTHMDGQRSPDVGGESMKPLLSRRPNSENDAVAFDLLDKPKSGCIDLDEKSISPTSSCSSATTGSEEQMFDEPLRPSPDFWGGFVKPIKSEIDAHDEFADVDILKSHSSRLHSPDRTDARLEKSGSDTNIIMRDPCPSSSIPSKSTEFSEPSEDKLRSGGQQFLSGKLPSQNGFSNGSTGCGSIGAAKVPSSSSSREDDVRVSERHLPSKHVNVSNLQIFERPKNSDSKVDRTNGNLDVEGNDSSSLSSSEAHLSSSSCSEKSILDSHSVENKLARGDANFSLDNSYLHSAKSETIASSKRVIGQVKTSNHTRHVSLGTENGIMGGSFSYELFVKLYNWNNIELYPCGLMNCGNSCYANAVLQCLVFTPPFTAYFLQGLHTKACNKKEWCFTCEFEALVKKAKKGNSLLSPARIVSQMHRIGSRLRHGSEEDAHEFLRYAIEAMQLVCLKGAEVNVPTTLDEETTLLGLTFGGYLQSKIECMGCGGKSKQHDKIMDLTVEIGGEIGCLEDALHHFTRSEILDGDNKYICGRCHSYQKAKKKLRVLEAPNVLAIVLKRFEFGKFGKLNKAVKFPDVLNLAQYMSGTNDKYPIYQLYGVVVHLDVMNATFSGHYLCYVKNNRGRWYKADDSMVEVVEPDQVLSKDAYMLFYSRCSPRAPRLIRSLIAPRDHRKGKCDQPCKSKSHPSEPWDVSGSGLSDSIDRKHSSYHPNRRQSNSEDDISENSSFFSEAGSYTTESSNAESTSTNDNFDQMLGDVGNCWNPQRRSTSDSDIISSSSSSSPSSLHTTTRHSPLANMNRYSDADRNIEADSFWTPSSNKDSKVRTHFHKNNESNR